MAKEKHHKRHSSFWTLRLAAQVSSYLDCEGLCAERATSRAKSSTKAHGIFKGAIGILKRNLFSFQAFVGHFVELVQSQGSLAQMEFVQLSVGPLSPVLRGQKSSRKSQRPSARATRRRASATSACPKEFPPAGVRGFYCLFHEASRFGHWWKANPRALSCLLKYMAIECEAAIAMLEQLVLLMGISVFLHLEDIVWDHAQGQSSAQWHQCGHQWHQCLWEGWTVARSIDIVWGDAPRQGSARCHQLHCSISACEKVGQWQIAYWYCFDAACCAQMCGGSPSELLGNLPSTWQRLHFGTRGVNDVLETWLQESQGHVWRNRMYNRYDVSRFSGWSDCSCGNSSPTTMGERELLWKEQWSSSAQAEIAWFADGEQSSWLKGGWNSIVSLQCL